MEIKHIDQPKTMGQRLRQAREFAGLTQLQAAKIIKASRTSFVAWEADEYEPNLATLRKLSEIYDVSLGWIVDGTSQLTAKRAKAIAALADGMSIEDFDSLITLLTMLKQDD